MVAIGHAVHPQPNAKEPTPARSRPLNFRDGQSSINAVIGR